MIVELVGTIVSPHDEIAKGWRTKAHSYQNQLQGKSHQSQRKGKRWATTDIGHGSTGGNQVRMLSIPGASPLEETMSQSHYAAIHGQYCNFSMDQGVRAKLQYLSATWHLSDNLRDFCYHGNVRELLTFQLVLLIRHFKLMYNPYRSVRHGTCSLSPTKRTSGSPVSVSRCIAV